MSSSDEFTQKILHYRRSKTEEGRGKIEDGRGKRGKKKKGRRLKVEGEKLSHAEGKVIANQREDRRRKTEANRS